MGDRQAPGWWGAVENRCHERPIKELMRWYCLNTNTHGCRRIVVSRGRLRRLLWVLFTLTAVALIFWQCALLISSFYTVSVSIKVHFQKLDFPAVTIEHSRSQEGVLIISPWGRDVQREGKIWEVTGWFSRWKTAVGVLGQGLGS